MSATVCTDSFLKSKAVRTARGLLPKGAGARVQEPPLSGEGGVTHWPGKLVIPGAVCESWFP